MMAGWKSKDGGELPQRDGSRAVLFLCPERGMERIAVKRLRTPSEAHLIRKRIFIRKKLRTQILWFSGAFMMHKQKLY